MNNELLAHRRRRSIGQVAVAAPPPSRIVPAIATSGYLAASCIRIYLLVRGRRIHGPGPDRGLRSGAAPDRVQAGTGR